LIGDYGILPAQEKGNPMKIDTRLQTLHQMGFYSYAEYLSSQTWRDIRLAVLSRGGWKCKSCGDRATQVHHSSYDYQTLQGASLKHLTPLCKICHKAAEFEDQKKNDLDSANKKLEKFCSPGKFIADGKASFDKTDFPTLKEYRKHLKNRC
jgi:hypothetical protein